MPYFPTAQAWLEQSSLLLSARPTTVRPESPCSTLPFANKIQTRITTKYTIKPPPPPKESPTSTTPEPSQPSQLSQPLQPKAFLTLKTYDPVSGACLKYKTDKAAEVGRLVASMGTCGRIMAALPEKLEETDVMEGVDGGVPVPEEKAVKPATKDSKGGQAKGGTAGGGGVGVGGGKNKKKGKR